jgi:LysM repeat protein
MLRNLARLFAPLALAAVAVGVYLIVHANVSPTSTTAHTTSSLVHSHRHTTASHHAKTKHTPSVYIVKSGDTLGEISSRTGVSIVKLATLNPSLKPPYNLQTGQRLRLRR